MQGIQPKPPVPQCKAPLNHRSLLQNIVCFIRLFCERDLNTKEPTNRSHPVYKGRGGGLGSRPKKMYGKRLGDGVEYHLMSPTPRR